MNSYELFAEFYDELMSDVDYEALAEKYDSLLPEKRGILLDLACGTGTLSVLLAQRGWDVIAADSSPEMLAKAKKHDKVSYICQDMTELDLFGTINAAVCSMDGLNHLLSEEELAAAIERVALFMEAGGIFVFDINTIYKHESVLDSNIFVKESENLFCVWQNEYVGDGEVDIILDIFVKQERPCRAGSARPKGCLPIAKNDGNYTRSTIELTEKAYSLDTIRHICEQSGFEVRSIIEEETNEKAVFVCQKVA